MSRSQYLDAVKKATSGCGSGNAVITPRPTPLDLSALSDTELMARFMQAVSVWKGQYPDKSHAQSAFDLFKEVASR